MTTSASPLAVAAGLALSSAVSDTLSLKPVEKGVRPAHHEDDHRGKFRNPWDSFRCVLLNSFTDCY